MKHEFFRMKKRDAKAFVDSVNDFQKRSVQREFRQRMREERAAALPEIPREVMYKTVLSARMHGDEGEDDIEVWDANNADPIECRAGEDCGWRYHWWHHEVLANRRHVEFRTIEGQPGVLIGGLEGSRGEY